MGSQPTIKNANGRIKVDMGQGTELSTANGAMNVRLGKYEGTLHVSSRTREISVNTKGAEQTTITKHRLG